MNDDPVKTDTNEDEALNTELENLRATFQTEWQKALAEGIHAPVIQELDEIPAEDDEEEETPEENAPEAPEEPPEKQKKKHSKALFAIPVALLTLLTVFFILYFIQTLRYPDFSRFLTAYTKAKFADTDEESLEEYKTAHSLDDDIRFFRRDILENIALLTCRTEGYAAAKTFISENFEEGEAEKSTDKDFLTLLNADPVIGTALDGIWEAADGAKDEDEPDYAGICTELGLPEMLHNDFIPGLTTLVEGKRADGEDRAAFETAVSAYTTAYRDLSAKLGVTPQALLEHILVEVYRRSSAVDAVEMMESLMTEEMKASPKTEAFSALLTNLEALKKAGVDVFTLAQKCVEDGVYGDGNIAALLPETLSEENRMSVAKIVSDVMSALRAVDDRNLTRAAAIETAALISSDALGLDVRRLAMSLFNLKFDLGALADAETVAANYLNDVISTPEGADPDGETADFLARYADFEVAFNAQKTVNDVFYDFYTAMTYTGEEMDRDTVFTALDELETADSPKELSAFIRFYKYLTLSFTDGKIADMISYLEQCRRLMPEHKGVYLVSLASCYRENGDYAAMTRVANEILAYDLSDDYANSVLAFNARRAGDDEKALALAESGLDLAGSGENCAKEAAIAALLREDYQKAYTYITEALEGVLTREKIELLKLTAALYDGRDEKLKADLAAAEKKYDAVMAQHNLEYSENTKAIIAGDKALEDVFMTAPYTLF